MGTKTVKFRDWVFEADVELTQQTYANAQVSGAEECTCGNCKNYLAFRDNIFPDEIKTLFNELGINYTKESEIITDQKHQNGLYDTSGWFHFKGRILNGKNAYIPISDTGVTIELTQVADNFLIGFGPGNSLAFFEDKDGLIEVMFQTNIPWVIDPELE
ncbi:hypothetical protein [Mucilaginibacter sp.]|uniref:hypothetical protein n=1 Tax=Mucilaginibacter sp. TaxID=1882438 RepID=UPI0026269252|nr:hypothetical protein [Mucilaginibacter sp.]MDB5126959.1 hypothetical protein [Mucilaginibacter sp.]